VKLQHGRVSLELHTRRDGDGPALLLLHALYGSAASWPAAVDRWPGPVHALDFSGHGASGAVRGGAYSPELLAGDADAALRELGSARLVGAGLGAWVALLLAASRADGVEAALLVPGTGLAGGGPLPDFDRELSEPWGHRSPAARGDWDPSVLHLEEDVRPVDYAGNLAAAARRLLFVQAEAAPPWWDAAQQSPAAEPPVRDLGAGLERLLAADARSAPGPS